MRGMVWICEYCNNLFLHHLRFISTTFGSPNAILAFVHLKYLILFFFSSNMQKLQGIFVCLSFLIGASCHHGPMWRYLWKLGPSSFKSSSNHDWSIVCNIFINVVSCIFIKGRVYYTKLGGWLCNAYTIPSFIVNDITTLVGG